MIIYRKSFSLVLTNLFAWEIIISNKISRMNLRAATLARLMESWALTRVWNSTKTFPRLDTVWRAIQVLYVLNVRFRSSVLLETIDVPTVAEASKKLESLLKLQSKLYCFSLPYSKLLNWVTRLKKLGAALLFPRVRRWIPAFYWRFFSNISR